jgi:hypothetical protein
MKIWILKDGEHGPYSRDELFRLLAAAKFSREDSARLDDPKRWLASTRRFNRLAVSSRSSRSSSKKPSTPPLPHQSPCRRYSRGPRVRVESEFPPQLRGSGCPMHRWSVRW